MEKRAAVLAPVETDAGAKAVAVGATAMVAARAAKAAEIFMVACVWKIMRWQHGGRFIAKGGKKDGSGLS